MAKSENALNIPLLILIGVVTVLIIFNQVQINSLTGMMSSSRHYSGGSIDLSGADISAIQNTAGTIAAVFPVDQMKTTDDTMALMFPTGTPDYGTALGVSFDDPVGSLDKLSKMYSGLKAEVQQQNPEAFARFVNLASNPYGVSCEYCCGVGPAGADKNGNSLCGCQHNPALLSTTLYLAAYTDYTDAEILREVMRWKTLFFPKNMIELGAKLGGGDTSVMQNLPGMVGGC